MPRTVTRSRTSRSHLSITRSNINRVIDKTHALLWCESDFGVYQDSAGTIPSVNQGDPVGKWKDQSAYGNHPIQSSTPIKPTLQLNAIGTRPAIAFNGLDQFLSVADNDTLTASYVTFYVVFNVTAISTQNQLILDKGNAEYSLRTFNSRLSPSIKSSSVTIPALFGWQTTFNGQFAVFMGAYDGSVVRFRRNSANELSAFQSGAIANGATDLSIGKFPFAGTIESVYVFDRVNAGEQARMANYLGYRTGLVI